MVDDGFSDAPFVPSSSSTAIRNPFYGRGGGGGGGSLGEEGERGAGRSSKSVLRKHGQCGCYKERAVVCLFTFSASKVRNIASLARKHCANNSSLNSPVRRLC